MLEEIKALFQLAEVGQSRSSITNPLQWTMVILAGAILLVALFKLPVWILGSLVIGLFLILALFIYAYLYFMHTNPDVLRSENFHLSKMAIERGAIGDSLLGVFADDRKHLRSTPEKLLAPGPGKDAGSAE